MAEWPVVDRVDKDGNKYQCYRINGKLYDKDLVDLYGGDYSKVDPE